MATDSYATAHMEDISEVTVPVQFPVVDQGVFEMDKDMYVLGVIRYLRETQPVTSIDLEHMIAHSDSVPLDDVPLAYLLKGSFK